MDFYQASTMDTTPEYTQSHFEDAVNGYNERASFLESKLKMLNYTMEHQFQTVVSLFNKVLNRQDDRPKSGWQQFTGNHRC